MGDRLGIPGVVDLFKKETKISFESYRIYSHRSLIFFAVVKNQKIDWTLERILTDLKF
jgi:hypothetical protein